MAVNSCCYTTVGAPGFILVFVSICDNLDSRLGEDELFRTARAHPLHAQPLGLGLGGDSSEKYELSTQLRDSIVATSLHGRDACRGV